MPKGNLTRPFLIAAAMAGSLCLAAPSLSSAAEKTSSAEEIISKSLESIGPAKARASVKSRASEGQVEFRVLSGAPVAVIDGNTVLLVDGRKLLLMMKLPNNDYQGERFIYDGDRVEIRSATGLHTRSSMGEFVHVQDAVIREGLLGGVLSTNWALAELDQHKAKVSYDGIKTVDGKQLHDLVYKPKKGSDLTIHLYFDPETFHHVRTVYTLSQRPGIVNVAGGSDVPVVDDRGITLSTPTTETSQARQNVLRYRLEERFSEFQTVDGLTLPTHYTIQFSNEQQNGITILSQWDNTIKNIVNNVPADPRNFQVK